MERARIVGRIPSRRPENRPPHVSITLLGEAGERSITLSSEEALAILQLPIFEPPRYIMGLPKVAGINIIGRDTLGFGDIERAVRKHGAKGFRQTDNICMIDFARMIAKIGYSYTVGVYGPIKLDRVLALPLILGVATDAGTWVGSRSFVTKSEKVGALHALTHEIYDAGGDSREPVLVALLLTGFPWSGTS